MRGKGMRGKAHFISERKRGVGSPWGRRKDRDFDPGWSS
jgi:hypothetical protein